MRRECGRGVESGVEWVSGVCVGGREREEGGTVRRECDRRR